MGLLDQLLKELQESQNPISTRYRHTTPTGTPVGPYMHGPGGLFSVAGLEREVISTVLQPRGLASMLPSRGTIDTNPYFPYITGFLSPTGAVADGVCDDPPVAGAIKNCIQTATFGRFSYKTRELELNRLGQRTNRGEFMDLRVVNNPLFDRLSSILAPNVPGSPDLARDVLERFMELGIDFQNTLLRKLYDGNPANNSAGGGYKEFPGLDILIGVNKVDAITGQACPSLRSDIKDFNYAKVDSGTLLNVMSYLMRYLGHIATRTNMSPVQWVLAMRPSLFWEITSIWACSYLTYRCSVVDTANIDAVPQVDVADAIRLRDDMRAGSYLLVDGVRYPVVQDDGIVEETAGDNANIDEGCFASDIYVVPLTVRGSMASTYWEYLDYSKGAMIGAVDGQYSPNDFWTDGGIYLWHKKPPLNWCVQWVAKTEPRLIFLTPHLAGRITNVQYCPLQHERDTVKDDPYFVDGGVTSRSPRSSDYSDWNLPQT